MSNESLNSINATGINEHIPPRPEYDIELHEPLNYYPQNPQTLLEVAETSMATIYGKLFAPNRDPKIVFNELCLDPYATPERSRILIATTNDQSGVPSFVGTMRVTFGKENNGGDLPPLEALELMNVPGGWEKWLGERNLTTEALVEIGRFAIGTKPGLRPQSHEILIALTKKAIEVAEQQGYKALLAIMPENILKLYRRGGFIPDAVPGAEINDNEKVRSLAKTYPRYWNRRDNPPTLYYIPIKNESDKSKP